MVAFHRSRYQYDFWPPETCGHLVGSPSGSLQKTTLVLNSLLIKFCSFGGTPSEKNTKDFVSPMCFFQNGSPNPGILAIRTTYEFLLKSTPNGHRVSSKKSAKKPETRWKYAKSTFSGKSQGGETTKTIFKRKRRPFATAFGNNNFCLKSLIFQ